MEFGKLNDITKLNDIHWDLPIDDPVSLKFLHKIKPYTRKFQIPLMGTPAWGHKEWIGKIYPPKTKPADFLYYYSRHFNTIELNTTHYRIPTTEQTQKWLAQVPEDFVFCPKIFQGLSHDINGMIDSDLHKAWYQFLETMNPSLGPCFLQLPPYFDYNYKAHLFHFLKMWPDEFSLALEFRHPSWFKDGHCLPGLNTYLQSRNIGLVITDVAGRRDILHTSISANFTLIRFIGNNLHPSDYIRAKIWNERLEQWKSQGLEKTIFFVHEPDDILAPEMSDHLRTLSFFNELSNRKSTHAQLPGLN